MDKKMTGPERYGKYYWCVKTAKKIVDEVEIYVYADEITITATGDLVANGSDGLPNLSLAAGSWTAFYKASCLDGHAVAVEHWQGEVNR